MFTLYGHKHKWVTLRANVGGYFSGGFYTSASQKCYGCGKTRQKRYQGKFSPTEIDA